LLPSAGSANACHHSLQLHGHLHARRQASEVHGAEAAFPEQCFTDTPRRPLVDLVPVIILEAPVVSCRTLGLVWRPPWFGSVGRSPVANPARRRRVLEIRRRLRGSCSDKAVGGHLFRYPFPDLSPHLPCSSRPTVHSVLVRAHRCVAPTLYARLFFVPPSPFLSNLCGWGLICLHLQPQRRTQRPAQRIRSAGSQVGDHYYVIICFCNKLLLLQFARQRFKGKKFVSFCTDLTGGYFCFLVFCPCVLLN
jgi:hypothetical protein